jgi:hypothetical protein
MTKVSYVGGIEVEVKGDLASSRLPQHPSATADALEVVGSLFDEFTSARLPSFQIEWRLKWRKSFVNIINRLRRKGQWAQKRAVGPRPNCCIMRKVKSGRSLALPPPHPNVTPSMRFPNEFVPSYC